LSPPFITRRATRWSLAITALLAPFLPESRAKVWPFNASDGAPNETSKLARSDWLDGADAIWLHYVYLMSVDCSPPRACYANSQLVNYHFSCVRGFIYVRERISMDLNGSVVNHQVFEPAPPSPLDPSAAHAFATLCGPPDDFEAGFGRGR
jgi:hypothetical protein